MKNIRNFAIAAVILILSCPSHAQMVPGDFEHISFLVTFSEDSNPAWGDDDHVQTFFFTVPNSFTKPVYIRIFDPNVGGMHDENNHGFNSKTSFSVYGGKGCYSNPDARQIDPVGEYNSGTLLAAKVFDANPRYDNDWYAMGPFNPLEGEADESMQAHILKIIVKGEDGDDGNHYRFFLSTQHDRNLEVEGANAFTYEYSFRIPEEPGSVSHLYPFIDDNIAAVVQHNFDLDKEADIIVYTVAKNRHIGKCSGNSGWSESRHDVVEEERNTSMDIQIIKNRSSRNDMVAYVTNEYNEAIAFFSNPIGGPPRFKYKVNVKYKSPDPKDPTDTGK